MKGYEFDCFLLFKGPCLAARSQALDFEVSHPHTHTLYLPPRGEVSIINPVALLQIYYGHSELQVSKYLTCGAFQLFTP